MMTFLGSRRNCAIALLMAFVIALAGCARTAKRADEPVIVTDGSLKLQLPEDFTASGDYDLDDPHANGDITLIEVKKNGVCQTPDSTDPMRCGVASKMVDIDYGPNGGVTKLKIKDKNANKGRTINSTKKFADWVYDASMHKYTINSSDAITGVKVQGYCQDCCTSGPGACEVTIHFAP